MLLWALTFQTMLLQSYCQLLSRAKNPGIYVPREDLSFFPVSREDEEMSYGEQVRPTEEDEDYDVDKDPDTEDPRSKGEDEWWDPTSYRPTVGRDTNYNASRVNEEAVYEYVQDTGWPTFTINILTRTTPFRETTQGKIWNDLTRTVMYWGKYPTIDRNKMLKLRPLLYTGEYTTSHPEFNNSTEQISQREFGYRPLKDASTAKFTHGAYYRPLIPQLNKVYPDPESRLYFRVNSTPAKPDPLWLSEEIALTEQDYNSSVAGEILTSTESSENFAVIRATIPEQENGPPSSTVVTPSTTTTFKQDNQLASATVLTPTKTTITFKRGNDSASTTAVTPISTTFKQDYESTSNTVVTPTKTTTFNQDYESASTTIVIPTKTTTFTQDYESASTTVVIPTRSTTSKLKKLWQEITTRRLIVPYYRDITILTAPPTAPDYNHEIKKITSTPKRKMPIRMKQAKPKNWKCYRCGLDDAEYGDPSCYSVFDTDDQSEKHMLRSSQYRTSCSGNEIFFGDCFTRYLDIGTDYVERGCRTWPPQTGSSYVSRRFMNLEKLLKHKHEGCVASPSAVLVPFSKAVHLYARFHVCVCRGKYCNATTSHIRHNYQCLLTLYFLYLLV